MFGAPRFEWLASHPIKLMDLNMLAVTGGMERTQNRYERLFAQAGLRLARVIATRGPLSILEAVATTITSPSRSRRAT